MRYLVISDVHSCLQPMLNALKERHYDPSKDTLVVLGDVFDHGPDTMGVYKYLSNLPNTILVKGNHEESYLRLLGKPLPDHYDMINGTARTFAQIAGVDCLEAVEYYWGNVREYVENSSVTKWVKSEQWLDYLELGDLILVHSFIPLHNHGDCDIYGQFKKGYELEYFPDWRTKATVREWNESRWGCPWKQMEHGYFGQEAARGKTLVCGHWASKDFHERYEGKSTHSIYYGDHIVCIDGSVRKSGVQNVLVIEDGRIVR